MFSLFFLPAFFRMLSLLLIHHCWLHLFQTTFTCHQHSALTFQVFKSLTLTALYCQFFCLRWCCCCTANATERAFFTLTHIYLTLIFHIWCMHHHNLTWYYQSIPGSRKFNLSWGRASWYDFKVLARLFVWITQLSTNLKF